MRNQGCEEKFRPMNVCAFLGDKTTEHESFSAQRNAAQGSKHLKKEGEFQFSDLILAPVRRLAFIEKHQAGFF